MGVGSRLDQEQAALAAVTPSPTSASKRWPGASVWPSWDLLEAPKDPFSIEREARLHRQAAGECGCGPAGGLGPRSRAVNESDLSSQTGELSTRGLDCMVKSASAQSGPFWGVSANADTLGNPFEAEQRGTIDNLAHWVVPIRGWIHLWLLLFCGDCALLSLLILFTGACVQEKPWKWCLEFCLPPPF